MRDSLIIYAGPFAFPDGGAAARRILGNVQSLIAAGHRVEVWSGQMRTRRDDPSPVPVRSLAERTAEALPRALRHMAYAGMGRRLVGALDAEPRTIAAVILYSGYTPYLQRLLAWSARTGVPVAFDAVEWYDPPRRSRWLTDPYYWNTELAMRWLAPRCGNAIAISRRLENHFAAAGCRTVRVPPTLDVAAIPARATPRADGNPITLSYAGTPGHKERLGPLLAAFARLKAERLRLRVAGIDTADLLRLDDVRAAGVRTLPRGVEVLGKVSHARAMALTQEADFSVLLRPDARFAQAGFPTKAVESLAAGTPIFGNLTSDLGDHLCHMKSAWLVRDIGVETILAGLSRLLSLPADALAAMRCAARAEALRAFDYRRHTAALDAFVRGLRPRCAH